MNHHMEVTVAVGDLRPGMMFKSTRLANGLDACYIDMIISVVILPSNIAEVMLLRIIERKTLDIVSLCRYADAEMYRSEYWTRVF